MMSKFSKLIPVFSLWLAGLAVCAHLIIPHDHHLNDSVSGKGESCPVSDEKTNHHTGFPVHCHAFNDLTSERATISFIPAKINHKNFETSSLFKLTDAELQIIFLTICDIRETFTDSNIVGCSPLRAPPSIA